MRLLRGGASLAVVCADDCIRVVTLSGAQLAAVPVVLTGPDGVHPGSPLPWEVVQDPDGALIVTHARSASVAKVCGKG